MIRPLGSLLGRAWFFLLSSLGTTTLTVIVFFIVLPVVIFLATVGPKTLRSGWRDVSMKQRVISVMITIVVWIGLFLWALARTIYQDHQGLVSANETLANENRKLRPIAERVEKSEKALRALTARLDNRARQQEKAEEYADFLDQGHSCSIKWADGLLKRDDAIIEAQRERSRRWLRGVYERLLRDFGRNTAERFRIGKTQGIVLGVSEIQDHQARLTELVEILKEIRSGQLALR